MTFSSQMVHDKGLRDLAARTHCTDLETSDPALTVWSAPQFEQFQTIFSHGLGQLQRHLNLLSNGQCCSDSSVLLMSTIIDITRAMISFLQRRHSMMQKLESLGRVVETESSQTWYAQPDTLWLRKAVADLKAKCDAFSWLVLEICQARQMSNDPPVTAITPMSVTEHKPSRPILRSYNSFSSLGSETPRDRSRNPFETRRDSDDSTVTTNPFSDGSSVYSAAAVSTGPSSLNPDSPVEVNETCADAGDDQNGASTLLSGLPEYILSAAWRDLLKPDFGMA